MLVVGHQRRADAVALGQLAGDAGILAGDAVGRRQGFQRAQADVAEIADRRGNEIKASLGLAGGNGLPPAARIGACGRRLSPCPLLSWRPL